MKRCGRCGDTKPFSEFYRNAARRDGYQSACKSCRSDINRAHYVTSEKRRTNVRARNMFDKRRAQEFAFNYLRENPCVDCGEDDVIVLEFDHVRGSKVESLGQMIRRRRSPEVLASEIAKCEVRCANCHRRKTAQRNGSWFKSLAA